LRQVEAELIIKRLHNRFAAVPVQRLDESGRCAGQLSGLVAPEREIIRRPHQTRCVRSENQISTRHKGHAASGDFSSNSGGYR